MRDPEMNIQAQIDELRKEMATKEGKAKRTLMEHIRLLNMRKETVQRMKNYGVKFRKNQD